MSISKGDRREKVLGVGRGLGARGHRMFIVAQGLLAVQMCVARCVHRCCLVSLITRLSGKHTKDRCRVFVDRSIRLANKSALVMTKLRQKSKEAGKGFDGERKGSRFRWAGVETVAVFLVSQMPSVWLAL